jgi:hypothetical protein
MTRTTLVALVAGALGLGAAGCNPFLTGEGLTDDPNNPTSATREALFMGVQATTFGQQESSVPLTICMWMQQCTGGGGRFVEQFGQYVIDEGSHSFDFNSVYTGGGLTDIRKIETAAAAAGDSLFLGIIQIYEALVVGTAADAWGDIPYTQALVAPTPALDNQLAVYDSIQALLSRAIVNLGGAGPGPGERDLVFGGEPTPWIEVAHTLKARYFLHTVEAAGAGLLGGRTAAQVYADAVAQASLGISAPANDFAAFHGASTSERNVWFQFSQTTFGIDLVAGKRLVDLLVARNDPRLPDYFAMNTTDDWTANHKYALGTMILDPNGNAEQVTAVSLDSLSGATEPAWPLTKGTTTTDNHVTWRNFGLPYGGDDVNSPQPAPTVSAVDGARNSPTFRQPFVTYQENELILAEAYNQGTPAQDVQALTHLNNARATVPLGALVAVTGAALFDSIMVEKYISLFQNVEVWSDYRRTCRPAITPFAGASPVFGGTIPGRLYYGSNERNTNPNIPAPSAQLATNGFRNRNDPNACP